MATLVETDVRIEVRMWRDIVDGVPTDHLKVIGKSFSDDGTPLRVFFSEDLWPQLGAARKDQVNGILNDAITFIKNRLGIS